MAPSTVDALMARLDHFEEKIEKKLDNNRTVLDALTVSVAEHHAAEEPRWDTIDALNKTVFGHGTEKPGLLTRVDRIEGWRSRVVWILTSIVAPLGVYGCYVAMQHFSTLKLPVK